MSVSMRPAYRFGRAPAAPPAALAPAALLGALLIAIAGAVYQLQPHSPKRSLELRAPASSAPTLAAPHNDAANVSGRQHTRAVQSVSSISA